jgi:hypothetical protein
VVREFLIRFALTNLAAKAKYYFLWDGLNAKKNEKYADKTHKYVNR